MNKRTRARVEAEAKVEVKAKAKAKANEVCIYSFVVEYENNINSNEHLNERLGAGGSQEIPDSRLKNC